VVTGQLRTSSLQHNSVYSPKMTALLLRIPEERRDSVVREVIVEMGDDDQRDVFDVLNERVKEYGW
jgi:hypothetical protein